ncbi:hypothetical protein BDV25DRAFT_164677 [Aspergillus avenaceus]|uniref:Uncharacterized protein n=1 Tax=Aspergillus avenaceus TaxID=36643 RepID=A0A5N6TGS3_ASPAV|nr:hypothetical protein BDV25DRAFT_164677 [Aspergillus avenaceus]
MSQCRESVTAFLEAPVDGRWEQHEQEGRNADDEATGELVVPDILPFSDPDISFDGLWDGLYGLGWMGMEEFSVC